MGYIDKSGGYYVGDRQRDDLAVPNRPSALHVWCGGEWVLDAAAQASQRRAEILDRLSAIDTDSIRPTREISAAIAAGRPAPAISVDKLTALESEADSLRTELRGLPT